MKSCDFKLAYGFEQFWYFTFFCNKLYSHSYFQRRSVNQRRVQNHIILRYNIECHARTTRCRMQSLANSRCGVQVYYVLAADIKDYSPQILPKYLCPPMHGVSFCFLLKIKCFSGHQCNFMLKNINWKSIGSQLSSSSPVPCFWHWIWTRNKVSCSNLLWVGWSIL